MKKIPVLLLLAFVLILGACGGDKDQASNHGTVDDGEAKNAYGTLDHGVDEKKIGFSLNGETIEEATNVPEEEKSKLMNVFEIYIDAFNEKDIDRYIDIVSEHTESFDKEEERAYMAEKFAEFDFARAASDVTIVEYSEKEAQVFAQLDTSMKQLVSGLETKSSGRQVTVFTKDDGEWKLSSVHYIGDEMKK